jgi:hypothetical protein
MSNQQELGARPFPTDAVVRVGSGRGFAVRGRDDKRHVITAAHCLPQSRYPSPRLAKIIKGLTFSRIMCSLGSKRRSIWGELCVLSLTDDIAAFREPDGQGLWEQRERYELFTETSMVVGVPPTIDAAGAPAWLLSQSLA